MIDMRSDTVTQPSAPMRAAMMAAPLGDDVLGDDPTVAALERTIAKCLGTESALFVPSGTMANQLAIRSACESGDEIIAHRDSHIIHYETGAPAALSGCMIAPLEGDGGIFDADAIDAVLRSADVHDPHSQMLVVENTHNRGGGSIWPLDHFAAVAARAHDASLHVHVDGARLFNATVAGDYAPSEFASHADSISVCFSKGLGAPVGSALAGRTSFITRARRFRKMFGGAMRQSGILAAAALYAIQHNIERLAADHANARVFAESLVGIEGLVLEREPANIPTNMIFFNVEPEKLGGLDAERFCDALAQRELAMIAMGPTRVRAVVHLDVNAKDIAEAGRRCVRVARDARAGAFGQAKDQQ